MKLSCYLFSGVNFAVNYYSRFQEAANIRRNENELKLNFQVFNVCGFFQPQIITNRENFQTLYGIPLCFIVIIHKHTVC